VTILRKKFSPPVEVAARTNKVQVCSKIPGNRCLIASSANILPLIRPTSASGEAEIML
jgi:hypothetical protein